MQGEIDAERCFARRCRNRWSEDPSLAQQATRRQPATLACLILLSAADLSHPGDGRKGVPWISALSKQESDLYTPLTAERALVEHIFLSNIAIMRREWENKTLVSLVSERIERDPVSGSTYLDDDLRKIGTWLKKACENTSEPLISFASGTFELHFCVPEKIDVVHILNKIYRAKQSLICAQAGQPQIQ
jgi:hypothetical protein